MRLLDANVFVRFLTRDDPRMLRAATRLFESLENGEDEVAVLESAVAEVVFVLSSRRLYGVARDEIRDRLIALLSLRSIHLVDKARCLRALDLYTEHRHLSFVDSLLVAAAQDEDPSEIYSFDRGFDGVAGVSRVEP